MNARSKIQRYCFTFTWPGENHIVIHTASIHLPLKAFSKDALARKHVDGDPAYYMNLPLTLISARSILERYTSENNDPHIPPPPPPPLVGCL